MSEANVETSAAKRPRRPGRRAAALAAPAAAPTPIWLQAPVTLFDSAGRLRGQVI